MAKYKVKKIGSTYFVGRKSKTSFGGDEFVLPLGRTYKYKSKKGAEKQAQRLSN